MPSPTRTFVLWLASACAALAANTSIAPDKPVINFRLPALTPEGNRAWLVRGSEARIFEEDRIGIKELTLSIFSGRPDGKVETLILSPAAEVRPSLALITGPSAIRVINDQFEAGGTGWSYNHREKIVSIAKNVRVTFQAELKDVLK